MNRVLGVFAKAPRPGPVKSRIAAAIGADVATRLYDAFLRDLLPRLTAVDAIRVLAFASPADHDFFRDLCGTEFELECQCGHDLGSRMAAFFRQRFARGADRVVLIGSDSPTLPLQRIEQAFSQLDEHDAVLGPTDDGGYYLIGLRRLDGRIFEGIDWSTSRVFAQTMGRLLDRGISHAVLQSWYDIDLVSDLVRLWRELQSARSEGLAHELVHTEQVLRTLHG